MYVFSLRKHKIHLIHSKAKFRSEAATSMILNFIVSSCYSTANKENFQNSLGDPHKPSLNSNRTCASKFLVTLKTSANLFAFR